MDQQKTSRRLTILRLQTNEACDQGASLGVQYDRRYADLLPSLAVVLCVAQ